MKKEKTFLVLLVLSIIAFVSTLILIGFDFSKDSFDINFRLDFGRITMEYIVFVVEELIHILASFIFIISILFFRKTKTPIYISLFLTFLAEILRFIFTEYYLGIFKGIFSYNFFISLYNLVVIIMLVVLVIIVIRYKKNFDLLIILSVLSIIIFMVLYFKPIIIYNQYMNLTVVSYYVSTYAMFGLIGLYEKYDNIQTLLGNV